MEKSVIYAGMMEDLLGGWERLTFFPLQILKITIRIPNCVFMSLWQKECGLKFLKGPEDIQRSRF